MSGAEFSWGKSAKHGASLYVMPDGRAFIRPCPVHYLIPLAHGIEMLTLNKKGRKPRHFWNWAQLKEHCSDCLDAAIVKAVDARVEECMTHERAEQAAGRESIFDEVVAAPGKGAGGGG